MYSADLDHVRVFGHDFDIARVGDFGHDRHAIFVAHFTQDFQAIDAQTLKGIGAGAWLVSAAAKDIRARGPHRLGDVIHAFGLFDRTWPGDHGQIAAADFHAAHFNNAGLRMRVFASQLVRRHHRHRIGHTGDGTQLFDGDLAFVADQAQDRAIRPAAKVGLEAKAFDPLENVLKLGLRDIGFEDNDHGRDVRNGYRKER